MTTPHQTCRCGTPAENHCHACDEWWVAHLARTGQPTPVA